MTAISEVRPGLVEITTPVEKGSAWQSPNLFLIGRDRLTLIDSGYARDEHLRVIREAIGKAHLDRILLTHGHLDHAGGAWALAAEFGAPVFAHPSESAALARRFPGQKPDQWLAPGETIQAGDFSLLVMLLPGHARGHLAFFEKAQGLFFSGDLVTGEGSTLIVPPEGNMQDYMKSLREIQGLPIKMILPGHGPLVHDPPRRIVELIEHRELREICIVKILAEKPLDLKALVRAMYYGLIHPHLEGAAAGTAWAHLEKLIAEGAVIAEPAGETNPFKQTFRLAPGIKIPF